MHSFYLLFTLGSCVIESLILLFDALSLAPHFLLPWFRCSILPLLILSFEFSNFFELSFFLDFKNCLLDCLGEQYVQNWLDFFVIIKEIIVSDLSDFVDSSFLRDILWSWRFRKEYICLCLNSYLFRRSSTLLSEEVSQINLYPCWRSRAEIIRRGFLFLLFEF